MAVLLLFIDYDKAECVQNDNTVAQHESSCCVGVSARQKFCDYLIGKRIEMESVFFFVLIKLLINKVAAGLIDKEIILIFLRVQFTKFL